MEEGVEVYICRCGGERSETVVTAKGAAEPGNATSGDDDFDRAHGDVLVSCSPENKVTTCARRE